MAKDQISVADILAIVAAADGIAVATIHDRTDRCFDIACSDHGRIYVHSYNQGATTAEIQQLRQSTACIGAKHAETRHPPRVATTGSQP